MKQRSSSRENARLPREGIPLFCGCTLYNVSGKRQKFSPSKRKAVLMYSLDVNTIIAILQTHAQTGLLRTDLPAGILEQTPACSATITVVRGSITSCAIFDEDGTARVLGDAAYHLLAHLGFLRWSLTLPLSSSLLPPAPALKATVGEHMVPRRLREPKAEQRTTWTRTHRLVFALIDGKKSAAQIARLLSLSPTRVQKALHDLYQMNLLALDSSRETRPASTTPAYSFERK